jgi:hypothetical protein
MQTESRWIRGGSCECRDVQASVLTVGGGRQPSWWMLWLCVCVCVCVCVCGERGRERGDGGNPVLVGLFFLNTRFLLPICKAPKHRLRLGSRV